MKLASGEMSEQILREIADEAYSSDPDLGQMARADLTAVFDRDPAGLLSQLFDEGRHPRLGFFHGHLVQGVRNYFNVYRVQGRFPLPGRPRERGPGRPGLTIRVEQGEALPHSFAKPFGAPVVHGVDVGMMVAIGEEV